MREESLPGTPTCPLVSSVVDLLLIISLYRYLKPSADSGGTHSNLGLLPDPNAESGESAMAVVAAKGSSSSPVRDYCSLLHCYHISNWFTHVQVRKSLNKKSVKHIFPPVLTKMLNIIAAKITSCTVIRLVAIMTISKIGKF